MFLPHSGLLDLPSTDGGGVKTGKVVTKVARPNGVKFLDSFANKADSDSDSEKDKLSLTVTSVGNFG